MKPFRFIFGLILMALFTLSYAQQFGNQNKFKQLEELATPNTYRTASGAPGHEYWQQRADYDIDINLDDIKQRIHGEETVTYYNNSPDVLTYLWLQLDQNVREKNSLGSQIAAMDFDDRVSSYYLGRFHSDYDGGFKLEYVRNADGNDLPYTINYTMMRIDLPEPLQPGHSFVFRIKWWYNINNRMKDGGGRSGMEYFEEDDNYIYTIAQFYPRMAVYSDFQGWQHKQFIGRGEFTLTFGNFDIDITVPADHIVGATGVLQNSEEVLTGEQISRFGKAKSASEPVFIVTEKEARKAEKSKSKQTKTWTFHADNVRDFAFASSRKFIWDAMGIKSGENDVMVMSFYPKDGNPLWEQYSTKVVAHTLKIYSRHTFDYPYPVAISVHTANIGMEYPMICFNGGRPEPDGTYSERTKWGMIGVITHEVGHNYFPMIVNSDERQWTWMDEGFNCFLQGVAEREWDHNIPDWTGNPEDVVDYMSGDKATISPIMTNSESVRNLGANAYSKTSAALNILRETVMGRELFDFAFREYAQRWMFKHPTPEDFFRTMEDASAVDLDWFWRGWFYSTDHVDIALTDVELFIADTRDPSIEKPLQRKKEEEQPEHISITRNKESIKTAIEEDETLKDFYDSFDEYAVTEADKKQYEKYMASLTEAEKTMLDPEKMYYELTFENKGGLVMPLILEFIFKEGSREEIRVPAEIWRYDNYKVSKVFMFDKEITSITLDPWLETADTDKSNNHWPPKIEQTRFQLYKYNRQPQPNPMQQMKK
jgi:hypothetical protein